MMKSANDAGAVTPTSPVMPVMSQRAIAREMAQVRDAFAALPPDVNALLRILIGVHIRQTLAQERGAECLDGLTGLTDERAAQ